MKVDSCSLLSPPEDRLAEELVEGVKIYRLPNGDELALTNDEFVELFVTRFRQLQTWRDEHRNEIEK